MDKIKAKAKELFDRGQSLVDIADVLKVSPGTVRSWKSRGKWGDTATQRRNVAKEQRNTQSAAPPPPPPATELSEALSDQQKLFCEIYAQNFNAAQAAIKANYSIPNARRIGYNLLQKPHVRAYVQYLQAQRKQSIMATVDDIVDRYMRIAFSDITDFVDFGRVVVPVMGAFGPVVVTDPDTGQQVTLKKEINDVRLKESYEVDGALISQIKQGKDGIGIKLEDRMKALEWLSRYFDVHPDSQRKAEYDERKLALAQRQVELQEQKANGDEDIEDMIEIRKAVFGDEIK